MRGRPGYIGDAERGGAVGGGWSRRVIDEGADDARSARTAIADHRMAAAGRLAVCAVRERLGGVTGSLAFASAKVGMSPVTA